MGLTLLGWDGIFPGREVTISQADLTDTCDISEYFSSFVKALEA